MLIKVTKDGTVTYRFYKKAYKKARWRKVGQRYLDEFFRFKEENPEAHGLILVL